MYRNLGVGILILISLVGNKKLTPERELIQYELQQYHKWLIENKYLLAPIHRPLPSPSTRLGKQELDPDTMERICDPPFATTEEAIKEFNNLLKDPTFLMKLRKGKEIVQLMPAGSPSSPPNVGCGDRAVRIVI